MNLFLLATVSTVVAALVFGAVRLFMGAGFDAFEVLVFAVIYWVFFFATQKFFCKASQEKAV